MMGCANCNGTCARCGLAGLGFTFNPDSVIEEAPTPLFELPAALDSPWPWIAGLVLLTAGAYFAGRTSGRRPRRRRRRA